MARFQTQYRTYNWVKKNPVIDKVRTILQDEDLYAKKKRAMLHRLTGVSVSTYDGWFEGDTRDPKHTTIAATITALGYEEAFVKREKLDLEAELKAAQAWSKRQKLAREKFKKSNGGSKK